VQNPVELYRRNVKTWCSLRAMTHHYRRVRRSESTGWIRLAGTGSESQSRVPVRAPENRWNRSISSGPTTAAISR